MESLALPSGVTVTTLRGQQPGPTVSVLGGVHGDEDEGVLAVLRIVEELRSVRLVGTVKTVAKANPVAWAAHSRESPLDGGNLARCFPGTHGLGPTQDLAADITTHVIQHADLLIDLHSAGLRYRMPLLCGFLRRAAGTELSRQAAVAFGAPLIWAHPTATAGRSLTAAHDLGVPAIYAECSGGGSIHTEELATYVDGVLSVLADLGMISPAARRDRIEPRWVYGSGDLDAGTRAKRPGYFVSSVQPGDEVSIDDEIGYCYDHQGCELEGVRAARSGVVMFLRRQARVQADDILYVLADHTAAG